MLDSHEKKYKKIHAIFFLNKGVKHDLKAAIVLLTKGTWEEIWWLMPDGTIYGKARSFLPLLSLFVYYKSTQFFSY